MSRLVSRACKEVIRQVQNARRVDQESMQAVGLDTEDSWPLEADSINLTLSCMQVNGSTPRVRSLSQQPPGRRAFLERAADSPVRGGAQGCKGCPDSAES
jgi:hypothetical protein